MDRTHPAPELVRFFLYLSFQRAGYEDIPIYRTMHSLNACYSLPAHLTPFTAFKKSFLTSPKYPYQCGYVPIALSLNLLLSQVNI